MTVIRTKWQIEAAQDMAKLHRAIMGSIDEGNIVGVNGHSQLYKVIDSRSVHNWKKWTVVLTLRGLSDDKVIDIEESEATVLVTPHEIAEWKIKQQTR